MRRDRGGGFRPLEEVAVAAGGLLEHPEEGMHLRAMAAWRRAVGERVHRVTRVAGMRGGTLTVDVPDRAWGDSLRGLERTILSRIGEGLGPDAPRRLELRIARGVWRPPGGLPRRRTGAEAARAAQAAPPEEAEPMQASEAPGHLSAPGDPLRESELPLSDPEQRRALCRIANRFLARRAGSRTAR